MASFMIDDILKKEDLPKDHGKNETTTNLNPKQLKLSFRPLHKYHCIPQVKNLPSDVTVNDETSKSEHFTIRRKRRVLFAREQTLELERVFQRHQYLTLQQRYHLSKRIKLSPTQVKIWFQNHRYKLKKYFKDNAIEAMPLGKMSGEKGTTCSPTEIYCRCKECALPCLPAPRKM
ncbi:homeobox protein DTH-1-like [Hydractinia symbiolongicarpus]|uniref:homeobox protein DTH-1-like n=1 Tax=Hydractinia symbiolongicarpus TaxID=13093 RepID=UPI00255010A3|nr:homeobox protein DTH-1-like [Hydractinia symbiolongicarpus]